jgi:hypothetical protein
MRVKEKLKLITFQSCSLNESVANNFADGKADGFCFKVLKWIVGLDTNKPAVYHISGSAYDISSLSHFCGEREVLLPPNSTLDIKNVRQDSDRHIVEMEATLWKPSWSNRHGWPAVLFFVGMVFFGFYFFKTILEMIFH